MKTGSPAPFRQYTVADRHEIAANHTRLMQRNSAHRRRGYDPDRGVQFVVEKALPAGGHVLDVGTGKGRFVIPLARHAARITTVDINPEEQHRARLEALHAGVADKIKFVHADGRALPWRAGTFDVVTSWNAFHHLDDPDRVFDEMVRVLKPGGKLVLADFDSRGFQLMDEILAAEGRRHPHPPNRLPHWRDRLRRRGFEVRCWEGHHQQVLVARDLPGATQSRAQKHVATTGTS